MKTKIINFASRRDKELFFKVMLISTLTMGTFVNLKKLKFKSQPMNVSNVSSDSFGDFDKVNIPNRTSVITKMITELKPQFSSTQRREVAGKIHQVFIKHKINPQIVVAIIDTESNFDQNAVSSSGDLSLAQVNAEVWNREFERMNKELIDVERLKKDEVYSLEVMAQILDILKTRYEKTDRRWYARYHSKTKKYKRAYLTKLESRMKRLEKLNLGAKEKPVMLAQAN